MSKEKTIYEKWNETSIKIYTEKEKQELLKSKITTPLKNNHGLRKNEANNV